jgi:hypothetical protein
MQRGGPLAEFADGYRDELLRQGFTANSVVTHVVLMGQLSRWRAGAGVAVEDLTLLGSRSSWIAAGLAGRGGFRWPGCWIPCSPVAGCRGGGPAAGRPVEAAGGFA